MRIFITGGSGLVGRNLVDRLSRTHEILAPSHGELDLMAADRVVEFVRQVAPDLIIHCAGTVGGIQANIANPDRFLVENFEVGKNVVLAAAKCGVERLFNLGSSCMYPREAPNPLKENSILDGRLEPTNEGYALAKIAVQRLCDYVTRNQQNLSYNTLIPCNLYGKWDNFDPIRSHLIPAVIRKLHFAKMNNEQIVDIWGSGRARREFMFAGDLADFVAFSLDRWQELPSILNVGIGMDYSVDEFYEVVARVVGYKGDFRHDHYKPEGMNQKLVDVTLVRELGWCAPTSLEEGVRTTYEFFLAQEQLR